MMAKKEMSPQDTISWLRLIRSEKIGPITFWQLLHKYGTASRALEALSDLINKGGQKVRLTTRSFCEKSNLAP